MIRLLNPLDEPQRDYVVIANRRSTSLERVDDK